MGTELTDHYAAGADDQSKKKQSKETKKENQNVGVPDQSNNPTDQQPSGSQHNEWQQDHEKTGSVDVKHQNFQTESSSQPAPQYRASEDDELGEEMSDNDQKESFLKVNRLESTDQDYRDGNNQSAEDQEDGDELRNGK